MDEILAILAGKNRQPQQHYLHPLDPKVKYVPYNNPPWDVVE